MKTDIIYCHEQPVRITDINFGNHLSHIALVEFIHDARANFLYSHKMSEANCFGFGIIITKIDVSYRRQSFFGDILLTKMSVSILDEKKIAFHFDIINKETQKTIANATTEMVFFDIEKQKSCLIPSEFKNFIEHLKNHGNNTL
jgi:YbgC/YbaW family acyl-CoA thioester hydrolase